MRSAAFVFLLAAATAGADCGPPARTPRPAAAQVAPLARANEAFALDVYARIRTSPGNLVFSPASLSNALTMAWAGASGETSAQMQRVLHLDPSTAPVQDAAVSSGLLASMDDAAHGVKLALADRLYADRSVPIDETWLDTMNGALGAPLQTFDFRRDAESARAKINGWVSDRTAGHVRDLVPPGGLDASTNLALVDAIYFLGTWDSPFEKRDTSPGPFHRTPTDAVDVPMMQQTASFRYATGDGVALLEMPYAGGGVAMTFVLPDAVDGLGALEQRLTPDLLARWTAAIAAASPQPVAVTLPRFEIHPTGALSLRALLSTLGMPLAFDRAAADFGRISPPSASRRLCIGDVFHEAYVKVDEQGTEAAAASAVVMMSTAPAPGGPQPPSFTADHPFLFLLRDEASGLVLFMGRVSDPSAG